MDLGPLPLSASPGGWPVVAVRPDARLSNLRPGWLASDTDWRDHLAAMSLADVEFFEHQWQLAGGRGPAVDTSWLTFTRGP